MSTNFIPLDIALDVISRGYAPVPVSLKTKKPYLDEWQNLRITAETAPEYFNGSKINVGAIMGPASDGLTDVDLDCMEAVRLAPYFLPPTGSIYGRPGKRRSHYLYKTNDPDDKASIKMQDENRKVLVELRMGGGGRGAQSVMPGSLHPSGEHYEWDEDGIVATTTCATLKAAIAKIAAGAFLARHWPEGSRHDAALRCGGFLARCGWQPDDIGDFMVLVQDAAKVADHDHIENGRKAAVDGAHHQLESGQGYGLPAMGEMFGEDVAKQLAKLIGYYAERQMPAAARGLRWREVTKRGHPVASFFNARVAVAALGVTCRYDLFHHNPRMWWNRSRMDGRRA